MFNIIENIHNVSITYVCPECNTIVSIPFKDTDIYKSMTSNEDAIIDYIEGHLSYDDLDLINANTHVSIKLPPQICSNKECKRTYLRKQKNDILEHIKVPLLHKNIPPLISLDNTFNNKPGVLYIGKVGAGKTYKAISLMKRYILSKGGVSKCTYKFINACEMFFKAQEEIHVKPKDGVSILRKCINVDILVIDDVGTEKFSEWTNSHLYFVINSRLENLRPTIITANILDINSIETKFSERIASRLSLYNAFVVRGFDRRKA